MEKSWERRTRLGLNLFLVSFISLYFEVLFIRWIPSSVQVLSYFTNIILIAAFLGLGLGCLLAEKSFDLMKVFPTLLLAVTLLLMAFNQVAISTDVVKDEYLLGSYTSRGISLLLVIGVIFAATALLFVPMGQKLGACLRTFPPLTAYSINIAGSVLGVVVFSALAHGMLPPGYWFLIGLAATLWFFANSWKALVVQGVVMAAALAVVLNINPGSLWSPYYRVDIEPLRSLRTGDLTAYLIGVNNLQHQHALDLSDASVARNPELARFRRIYEFPYRFVQPQTVLILGAGSGNDAAAALRLGVPDITAVEIDPLIAATGQYLHPEQPYQSTRVRLVVDDARAFVRQSERRYDLITFGYLDAHRVLSQFSSVRLDNFIYTRDSFAELKNRLAPDGLVALTYLVFREWVAAKLYTALREVFGDELVVFRTKNFKDDDTAIFLAGPGARRVTAEGVPGFHRYDGFDKNAHYIVDDWPYLYLARPGIPGHYFIVLSLVVVLAFGAVAVASPVSLRRFNVHFFFLGAGFMLLETVSITRFALLFGSTWTVNAAVIIAILVMILLANFAVSRIKCVNLHLIYVLLAAAILLNWFLDPAVYLRLGSGTATVLASFILALPLFFAGIIFATSFRKTETPAAVFGFNLLGAIVGGVCEYLSMATGFGLLLFVALGMYAVSYLGLFGKKT